MRKTQPINMRATPEQQALLNKAAEALNMDRSAFILKTSCEEAERVLLERRLFQLDDTAYNKFLEILDSPIVKSKKLRELLNKKSPWED